MDKPVKMHAILSWNPIRGFLFSSGSRSRLYLVILEALCLLHGDIMAVVVPLVKKRKTNKQKKQKKEKTDWEGGRKIQSVP